MNTVKNLSSPQGPQNSRFFKRDEIDVFALLRILWRGRIWVVLCMLVGFLSGGYYAYRIAQPNYSATVLIEFVPIQSQLLGLESIVAGTSVDTASLNTELATIRSREMAELVVKKLELFKDPAFTSTPTVTWKDQIKDLLGMMPPPQVMTDERRESMAFRRATAWVQNSITANGTRETYLLEITAHASKATAAWQLANTIAEAYIQSQLEEKFAETEQAIDWLSDRVRELEADLREREIQINNLQSDTDLVDRDAYTALQLQTKDFRDRLRGREETLIAIQEKTATYEKALASQSKSEILAAFDDRILVSISARLGESLEGSVRDRDSFLARAETLTEASRLSIVRAQSEITILSSSVKDLEVQVEEQSRDLRMLEQMRRELSVSQALYNTFLVGLQETTVQVGLVRPDSRIMSRADLPRVAFSPRKARILAISLFAGFLLGFTFLLLREFLNNRIQDMNDLENLTNLPVLGSVPIFPIRKRKDLFGFLASNPTSSEMEAVRNLRTSVLMQDFDVPPKLIMVTSSIPGEGKTSLCLSLAHNFSGLGKRVLLIEGDIRRRTLNNYVEVSDNTHGLLDAVTGDVPLADAIIHTPDIGIDILVGQKSNVNPADLFSSSAFKSLIEKLKADYDHIIIDTPPVLVVPDARIITSMADRTLYVVKWDSTSREQILSGVKLFEAFGHPPSGFVITQVNARKIRKYGYGDQYGSYARYGSSYYTK